MIKEDLELAKKEAEIRFKDHYLDLNDFNIASVEAVKTGSVKLTEPVYQDYSGRRNDFIEGAKWICYNPPSGMIERFEKLSLAFYREEIFGKFDDKPITYKPDGSEETLGEFRVRWIQEHWNENINPED